MFGSTRLVSLGFLAVRALVAFAADSAQTPLNPGEKDNVGQSTSLKVKVAASFPNSEVFGVKLVNGYPTHVAINFTNEELDPVNVQFIGGSLWSPAAPDQTSILIRNLTTTVYRGEIPAGEKESFSYKFTTEMHPTDLVLKIISVIADSEGAIHTLTAFDGPVSVVEPPQSIFDAGNIFLYLVLAGAFAGTAYFIYSTWITTLFPQQKRRGGKDGSRAKTDSTRTKKVDPAAQVSVPGADGPAVASGSKGYDESWIPQQHLSKRDGGKGKTKRAN